LIFPTPYLIVLPYKLKFLTLIVCILGGIIGYYLSLTSLYFYNKSLNINYIINFLSIMWFIPFISTLFIFKFPLKIGGLIKYTDQGWREYFGAINLFKYLKTLSQFYQVIHYNSLKLYLLSFILWFILVILLLLLSLGLN